MSGFMKNTDAAKINMAEARITVFLQDGALRGVPAEGVSCNNVQLKGKAFPSQRINPFRSRSFVEPKATLTACFLTVLRF